MQFNVTKARPPTDFGMRQRCRIQSNPLRNVRYCVRRAQLRYTFLRSVSDASLSSVPRIGTSFWDADCETEEYDGQLFRPSEARSHSRAQ